MKTYVVVLGLAFLLALLGTPIFTRLWTRLGFLDSAITAGVHQRRHVPRLGGVIIYLALGGALLALFFPSNVITEQFRQELPTFWLLWGPATFILLLGVADDIWGMNAWVKFAAQVGAGLWLVSVGIQITHLSMPWGGRVELGWLSGIITLLWVVALTNAFNLIDGLDGLATGVGFLSASAIAVTAMMLDAKMVVVVSLALAGALLGFLRHNFTPASIFLGDSGSMFVGFVLAASAVVWHQKATTTVAVMAPLLAFALPVADTTLAVVRRTLRGQHWFASDRQHIHHRLVALGLTPRQVVWMLYSFSALGAAGCLLVGRVHNIVTAAVVFSIVAIIVVSAALLYPDYFRVGRGWSVAGVRARLQASEAIDSLLAAGTWQEFTSRMRAAIPLLEIDFLSIEFPTKRFQWGQTDGSSFRELVVPLNSSARMLVGRDLRRKSVHWPIEVIGRDLAMAASRLVAQVERSEPHVAKMQRNVPLVQEQ